MLSFCSFNSLWGVLSPHTFSPYGLSVQHGYNGEQALLPPAPYWVSWEAPAHNNYRRNIPPELAAAPTLTGPATPGILGTNALFPPL